MTDATIHIGVVTPHVAPGPEVEFPEMVPGRLVTHMARVPTEDVPVDLATRPPAPVAATRLAASPALDNAAELLTTVGIEAIGYASTSVAYAIGFVAEAAMVQRLQRRTNLPVAATCASAVLAMQVLGVDRIALVSPPWFDDELNELGVAYFRSQRLGVVSSASAGLSQDPNRIEPADVCEWVARHATDDADVVFIGGNGFRAAGAIGALEATLGRPILTSNQVLLWALLALARSTVKVSGYGQLFAREPPPDILDGKGWPG